MPLFALLSGSVNQGLLYFYPFRRNVTLTKSHKNPFNRDLKTPDKIFFEVAADRLGLFKNQIRGILDQSLYSLAPKDEALAKFAAAM